MTLVLCSDCHQEYPATSLAGGRCHPCVVQRTIDDNPDLTMDAIMAALMAGYLTTGQAMRLSGFDDVAAWREHQVRYGVELKERAAGWWRTYRERWPAWGAQ